VECHEFGYGWDATSLRRLARWCRPVGWALPDGPTCPGPPRRPQQETALPRAAGPQPAKQSGEWRCRRVAGTPREAGDGRRPAVPSRDAGGAPILGIVGYNERVLSASRCTESATTSSEAVARKRGGRRPHGERATARDDGSENPKPNRRRPRRTQSRRCHPTAVPAPREPRETYGGRSSGRPAPLDPETHEGVPNWMV
jgi:hypothetical protein